MDQRARTGTVTAAFIGSIEARKGRPPPCPPTAPQQQSCQVPALLEGISLSQFTLQLNENLLFALCFPPAPPGVLWPLGQRDEVSPGRALQDGGRVWVTPAHSILIEEHFQAA